MAGFLGAWEYLAIWLVGWLIGWLSGKCPEVRDGDWSLVMFAG